MLAIVNALIGSLRGMIRTARPLVITMCFPWRFTIKPHFSRAHCLEIVHSSRLGHKLGCCHYDDSSLEARGILRNDRKVSLNRVRNVGQCFVFGLALGSATRQTWHPNSDAFLRPLQSNRVSNTRSLLFVPISRHPPQSFCDTLICTRCL